MVNVIILDSKATGPVLAPQQRTRHAMVMEPGNSRKAPRSSAVINKPGCYGIFGRGAVVQWDTTIPPPDTVDLGLSGYHSAPFPGGGSAPGSNVISLTSLIRPFLDITASSSPVEVVSRRETSQHPLPASLIKDFLDTTASFPGGA